MKFGFLAVLVIGLLVIGIGGFAWLAVTDMPVAQHDITVNVPLQQ